MTPLNAHRAALLCIATLIAGCASTPPPAPVYITSPLPPLPAECEASCQAEPKLPDRDITDIDIAKDRTAFKAAIRCEVAKRRTCAARLKASGIEPANAR